jgi:hypothetical protein
VTQAMVSNRIKLHELPDRIKDFTTQNLVSERQLIDILPLSLEWYFQSWLTTDQVRMKCAEGINQHKGKKTDEERLGGKDYHSTSKDHKSEKGSKPKTDPHDAIKGFFKNSEIIKSHNEPLQLILKS